LSKTTKKKYYEMKFIRTITTGVLACMAVAVMAADYTTEGQYVTIPVKKVKAGGAQVVRLQVVNDNIIRVQATSEAQLPEKQSLIIVPQTAKPKFTVTDGDRVSVKAANVEARVDKETGAVTFYDANGKQLLKEAEDGKTFKPFRVPDR
jgi:alpha-D-xyloside xylohydrolase